MPKKKPEKLEIRKLADYKGYSIRQYRYTNGSIDYSGFKGRIIFNRGTLRELKSLIADYEKRKSGKIKLHSSMLKKTKHIRQKGKLKGYSEGTRKY